MSYWSIYHTIQTPIIICEHNFQKKTSTFDTLGYSSYDLKVKFQGYLTARLCDIVTVIKINWMVLDLLESV